MARKPVYYGGQAVLEGVMIRGPSSMAVVCRRPDGGLAVHSERLSGLYVGTARRIPFVRGIIILWETLVLGMRALFFSSNVALEEEEKEAGAGAMLLPGLISLVVVAGVFFAGPVFLAGWLEGAIDNDYAVVAIEGVIRLLLLIAYIWFIGLMPDIKRVFAYHGAEHKAIHALEAGDALVPDAVQRYEKAHVRCGTSFLLTVMIVAIVVFTAMGAPDLWLRVLSRIVLIPVVAAISYELIRLSARYEHTAIVRWLMKPNLALQGLTTREPSEDQVEVAIRALNEVLKTEGMEPSEARA